MWKVTRGEKSKFPLLFRYGSCFFQEGGCKGINNQICEEDPGHVSR